MGLIGLGAPGCDWTSCEDEAFLRTAAITGGHHEVIQVCFEGIELRQDLHDFQTLGTVVKTRLEYHGYTNIEVCMSIAFRMEVLCPKEMTFFSSARLASLRLMGRVGTWCHGRCFYPHMLNIRRERLSYHSRILNQVYSNNSPRLLLKVLQGPFEDEI